jgi:hypothetical protein
MIEDDAMQYACRQKLFTLAVITPIVTTLGVSAAGGVDGKSAITRAAGSFVTDGLKAGLEVQGAGFAAASKANGALTVIRVAPLILTVEKQDANGNVVPLLNDAAQAGRSLSIGIPERNSWENIPFDPVQGRVYFEEQFLPGPVSQKTLGPLAILEAEPQYIVNVYVRHGLGIDADAKYVNAIRKLFAPGTRINLANPDDLFVVRRDIAPTKSQRQFQAAGFAVSTFAIPLRLHTQNTI